MDQEPNAGKAEVDEIIFSDGERSLTRQGLRVIRSRESAHWTFDEDILLLVDAIEAIETERARLAAIVSKDFENTKLIDINLSGPDFSMALADGPIPYLVEYLAQMLGHRQLETPLNYSAIDLSHREFGPMVLTLQRKHGKSPQSAAAEHLARLRTLETQLAADGLSKEDALKDLQAYLSTVPSKVAT